MRLDSWLTENGFFSSRSRARQAIDAGAVRVNGAVTTKPALIITENDVVEADREVLRFVSKGGYKLEKAILAFHLDFRDKTVIDVGASTGGFTDCALQYGARRVFAVSLGQSKLVQTLRDHPAVECIEGVDIREATAEAFGGGVDWILIDVPIVHLRLLFQALPPLMHPGAGLLALFSPQFEQEKSTHYHQGGQPREDRLRQQILKKMERYAADYGFKAMGIIAADTEAGKGQEFLLHLVLDTPERNFA
jgi:23S rRNA (cytidine1920-2'-O)/16S rRNA (cytidine1409-2'-O)-methyltransferase